MMKIGGFIDVSTKDIPGKVCMVIFTVGCNFKCEYCHNKYLLQEGVGRNIELAAIMERVRRNVLVDSVNISGGEPTLQSDIVEVCSEIKQAGKYIGLDTNGSMPNILKKLMGHLNRVSIDIKAPLEVEKYKHITRVNVDIETIINSIELVNNERSVDLEVRTTYVDNLHTPQDVHEILFFLEDLGFKGNFVLQQYQFSEGVGEKYREIYYIPEHENLMKILHTYPNKNPSFKIFLRDNVVGYEAFS